MAVNDGMTEADILEAMLEKEQVEISLLRVEIEHLRGQRDAAMKALKPFADAADDLGEKRDTDHLWESAAAMNLTAGDLRRAAALLPQQQNTTQEKT